MSPDMGACVSVPSPAMPRMLIRRSRAPRPRVRKGLRPTAQAHSSSIAQKTLSDRRRTGASSRRARGSSPQTARSARKTQPSAQPSHSGIPTAHSSSGAQASKANAGPREAQAVRTRDSYSGMSLAYLPESSSSLTAAH